MNAAPTPAALQDWPTAQETAATDPARSGVMAGFPPPAAARVTPANWMQTPHVRWAVRNTRKSMPTADISRAGPVALLPEQLQALDDVAFHDLQGRPRTVGDYLARQPIDGFIVIQHGNVVYERYPGSMQPHEQHSLASITKCFTGLLSTWAAHDGLIDPQQRLAHYVAELAGTPVGEATVQQNLDMAVAVKFPVDQPFNYGYWSAAGLFSQIAGGPTTVYDFISRVGESAPGTGQVMQYQSSSPEAVNWALQRVTGQLWHEWLGERIWSRLGAERDAYTGLDRAGMPLAAGGLSTTLRDLARFGVMLCQGGYFNGQQIVPEAVVKRLFSQADNHDAFASGNFAKKSADSGVRYTYKNCWYQTGGDLPAFQAHGILSQYLHVAPQDGLVVVQLASTALDQPILLPSFNRAVIAITQRLRQAAA